ncbi:MAG: hypothetical protein CME61_03015 [Halobacteriovoraceae bacterium]|nr:hypothetical protein [Halobacteriovoraceae bacterium]
MINKNISFLFLFFLSCGELSAEIISQQINIKIKKNSEIFCERVDKKLVQCEGSSAINTSQKKLNAVSSINQISSNKIQIYLTSDKWKFFGYSKPGQSDIYTIDFWKQKLAPESSKKVEKVQTVTKLNKKTDSLKLKRASRSKEKNSKKIKVSATSKTSGKDFRYGSVFLWDHGPLAPEINLGFDFKRKTPDQLVNLKNRNVESSDEEAHLQLTLNLFRKMKWGLMFKSIDLFDQKYPNSKNNSFNEFLKLNALLKERYIQGKTSPNKAQVNNLEIFLETAEDKEYALSVSEYLLAYYVSQKNTEKILELSKKVFVYGKQNYMPEKMLTGLNFMLLSLSERSQIEQITKLVNDSEVKKYLPSLRVREFQVYANLKNGVLDRVLEVKSELKNKAIESLPRSLVYNFGETYFRLGKFEQAKNFFDEFASRFGEHPLSSKARLRLSLIYDLKNKKLNLVKALYKNTIDRSSNVLDRFEASIRLAGVGLREKQKNNNSYLLEMPKGLSEEKVPLNIKKLLWITRMRLLINNGKYELAQNYFENLPIDRIPLVDRMVFYNDLSEVFLGRMNLAFSKKDYAEVIKIFSDLELAKYKFVKKGPLHYHLEASSYVRLGLEKSANSSLRMAESTKDYNYPIWIKKEKRESIKNSVNIIKFQNALDGKRYSEAKNILKSVDSISIKNKLSLELDFQRKKYKSYARGVENYFLKNLDKKLSSVDVSEMMGNYVFSLLMSENYIKSKNVLDVSLKNKSYKKWNQNQLLFILTSLIEYYSSPRHSDEKLEPLISTFQETFPNGAASARVQYIIAKRKINQGNNQEGERLLQDVIKNKSTKGYIKELATSELALIKIKQKTI